MAQDTSESKTSAATPRRLREARRRGQVAKSTELAGAASLLCTLLCVMGLAPWGSRQIANFGQATDRSIESISLHAVQTMFLEALRLMLELTLVPLGVAGLTYMACLWLQTGPLFSLDPVQPQLARIDPVDGAKRLFSVRSLVQVALLMVKAGVIGSAAALVCADSLGDAIRVTYADAGAALAVANAALSNLLLWCGGLFVLLGLADLAYQQWQYQRDLRMSHREVRREHKEDQGDDKLKSQRRSLAREATPREQLEFIHLASLVIVDSQGRVVALVHRPQTHPMPLCLVRGTGDMAIDILAEATRRRIERVIDTPLVAALFPMAQPGAPIPPRHLDAVLAHLTRHASRPLD